jgi:uncharacterized damage-inducible protein DinB
VLSDEQFTRDLGGSFRSVRDTLVHIIAGEWGWLVYWKEPTHSAAFLADLRERRGRPVPSGSISERRCGAGQVDGG